MSGLVTIAALNTKVEEVKNKIPDVTGLLVNKIVYQAKISDTEGKYFTTYDYNKSTGEILDTKLKQKNLAKHIDLNTVSELDQKIENRKVANTWFMLFSRKKMNKNLII